MAIIVKYVVVVDGKDDMSFSTRQEAAAHDKMLAIAERLFAVLHTAALPIAEETLEALTWFMAQHRADIGPILQGRRRQTPAGRPPQAPAGPQGPQEASPAVAPTRRKAVPSALPPLHPAAAEADRAETRVHAGLRSPAPTRRAIAAPGRPVSLPVEREATVRRSPVP